MGAFGAAGATALAGPTGLVIGRPGDLSVASFRNNAICRYHGRRLMMDSSDRADRTVTVTLAGEGR